MTIKAKGSSLRRGGHKPLHFDELPTKPDRPKWRRINNGLDVKATAKALLKWQHMYTTGLVLLHDEFDLEVKVQLHQQTYKTAKVLIEFLRKQCQGDLVMQYKG